MGSKLDYRIIKKKLTNKQVYKEFDNIMSSLNYESYSGTLIQKEGIKISKRIFSSDDDAIIWIDENNDRNDPADAVKISDDPIPKRLLNKLKKANNRLEDCKKHETFFSDIGIKSREAYEKEKEYRIKIWNKKKR